MDCKTNSLILLFLSTFLYADQIQLVKDINQNGPNPSSSPSNITTVGPSAFMIVDDGIHGRELWKTSGSAESTVLVKDLVPGGESALRWRSFTSSKNVLYFLTWSRTTIDLWKSGGDSSTTFILKQFLRSDLHGPEITEMRPFNEGVVFVVNSKQLGAEPWITDGTAAGTRILKDLNPGSASSYPRDFVAYNGFLFFSATSVANGTELWRSDGTESGTTLVQDLSAGRKFSSPFGLRAFNNYLYFSAWDDVHGRELWRTNGTANGAQLVSDLNPGSSSSNPTIRTIFNGNLILTTARSSRVYKMDQAERFTLLTPSVNLEFVDSFVSTPGNLYFRANDGSSTTQVWQTDGTVVGTYATRTSDGSFFTNPGPMARVGNKLLVVVFGGVWVISGNPKESRMLPIVGELSNPESFGNFTFFTAFHSTAGYELWVTDGTPVGTRLVKDIARGNGSSSPSEFHQLGQYFYFTADVRQERFAFRTDGTSAGTIRILSQPVSKLIVFNNKLFLQIGEKLFTSDPKGSNLVQIADNLIIGPIWITVGSRLIFAANKPDLYGDHTLWSTNGTSAGTIQLHSSLRIPNYPYPHPVGFTKIGNIALIQAWNDSSYQLWATDGTISGTRSIKKFGQSYPVFFDGAVYKNQFYFGYEQELWKTTGESLNTVKVLTFPDYITTLESAGNLLAVGSFSSSNNTTLWVSHNGSSFNPFPMGKKRLSSMTQLGTAIVFQVRDELWTTSGTEDSTFKLASVILGKSIQIDQKIYFAGESTTGKEFWTSDGTIMGTHLVYDINPGRYGSDPAHFLLFKEHIYFSANDGRIGQELWRFLPGK